VSFALELRAWIDRSGGARTNSREAPTATARAQCRQDAGAGIIAPPNHGSNHELNIVAGLLKRLAATRPVPPSRAAGLYIRRAP
jgi:hypothetical protein